MINYVKLLRPKQWIKNLLIFAVILFSRNIFNLDLLALVLLGFIAFCLISSSVYILNDITDREKDKLHPKKCKRPIASGKVTVFSATLLGALSLIVALTLAFNINFNFAILLVIYFLINVSYSFYLKKVAIVDILIVAIGFVLRVIAGGLIINLDVSPWLLVCTFFLALFIIINKRKSELERMSQNDATRSVLKNYSLSLLKDFSSVADSSVIISYTLYVINLHNYIMMISIIFVVYGLFRYQYIIYNKEITETPEMALFQDRPLLVCVSLWLIFCFVVFYFLKVDI